jgi:short subunit dehydrogenase-like uncharacterized protein
MTDAELDVVVFGATSFVGKLVCEYLTVRAGSGDGALRWAMAGRSREKLEALRRSLPPSVSELTALVADAADEASLAAMCARTRVVLSTVGPYALYGEPLVRVCAETGTDYCDLTGEVQWISRMLARYERRAQDSGARIVHCCGFDSIPSDLGVWFLQQSAQAQFGEAATRVKMRVERARGGVSGGTIASMLNLMEEAAGDRRLRLELDDPYSLCPPDDARRVAQRSRKTAAYDPDFEAWAAPFVMAAINTRVVLRSNALAGYPYGDAFQYDEALLTGSGIKGRAAAVAVAAGSAGFMLGAALAPTRWAMKRVLPKPGQGPGAVARERGGYDLRFLGFTPGGSRLRTRVTGDRDPGYGSTAKMFAEAGACLARDIQSDKPGGFWTPATIFGDRLIARLRNHAGMTFDMDPKVY